MKSIKTNLLVLLATAAAITLGAPAFAQDTRVKLTVIKDDPMLELQTAEMTVESSNGVFSGVTATNLKFALDLKNEKEIFKATLTQAGRTKNVEFIVQESDVTDCGIKTYRAIPAAPSQGNLILVLTDTPPQCSGIIPEAVWSAQIVSTLGQTEAVDGELNIVGTPKVLEQ